MVEIKIEGIDSKGWAYSFYRGKRIRVKYGVPGDKIEARIKKGWGEILEIKTASEKRAEPLCKHFGICGGCRFQNLKYEAQLEYKKEKIVKHFRDNNLKVRVAEVVPSPKEYFYRNRMDFVVGKVENEAVIGLRKVGKWDMLVPISQCYLMSEESIQIIKTIKEFMNEKRIEPYNIFNHTGFIRYVVIREGKFTGDRMIIIVTAEGEFPYFYELGERLKNVSTSLIWSVNAGLADVSFGEDIRVTAGKDCLEEEINGIKYCIHPNAFFQTNSYQAVNMVNIVKELATGGDLLLDLYCGVGLFSLQLAPFYKKTVGVENNKYAIDSAMKNKDQVESEIKFFNGTVEEVLSRKSNIKPTTVIIDPPRTGLSKKVIRILLNMKAKEIIYVSCNPESMARDIKSLSETYQIEGEIIPLDMFPQTPHIEAIAKLKLVH